MSMSFPPTRSPSTSPPAVAPMVGGGTHVVAAINLVGGATNVVGGGSCNNLSMKTCSH